MPQAAAQLIDFIEQDILENESKIKRDTVLFSSGLLDSLALVELVTFIEEAFGLKIGASDLNPESFDTVSSMEKLINQKLGD